jgi:hypothetical protein
MTTQIETLDQKFHTLSDKYKLVKTHDLIAKIESLGFKLERFVANRTRKVEKRGFQKHRAIFTSPSLKSDIFDGVPQLLLTNSHDGTSSVILQLGFFRIVCANGLVVGNNLIEPIRIRHTGNVDDELSKGIDTLVAQCDKLIESIKKMKARTLSDDEIEKFKRKALAFRIDSDDKSKQIVDFTFPIHRVEDKGNDLFTIFNVVQENLIRGGATVRTTDENNQERVRKLRKTNSIDTQTKINTGLWELAEELVA